MRRQALLRRALIAVLLAVPAIATTSVAVAGPVSLARPGGLRPDRSAQSTAESTGDCGLAGVTCKPWSSAVDAASCTGYSSQTKAPATIRVLVRTSSKAAEIETVPFETYVENVLPDEWPASWDADALRAGAVAVKSYGWYWVTHFGGYVGKPSNCFDVTDDTAFQVYKAGSANSRTTAAVEATWPVAIRQDGDIMQAQYRAYLRSSSEGCGTAANGSQMSQYGTQACVEASSGNKYNVILARYYYPGLQLATSRQRRTAHDFSFVARSSRATFAAGHWAVDDGYGTTFTLGRSGDRPVITTAGDGFAHIGVFRPSNGDWYLGGPTGKLARTVQFGTRGDVPVAAQYAGNDQPTVLAVFRPSTGRWYEATGTGHIAARIRYGIAGDVPVPGHYYGAAANDYADDLAVYRPSTSQWYLRGHRPISYGAAGDVPIPADYDGNGTTDLAVYRPSTHTFYVRGHAGVAFGKAGDIPVTGDFTGDGKADLALYRPSTHQWLVRGAASVTFGSGSAAPIGAGPYVD